MKKSTSKKSRFNVCLLLITILLLTSCSVGKSLHDSSVSREGAPFFLGYNTEEIIRDQRQVATITSVSGLEIDGVEVKPQNMRSANAGGFLNLRWL